METVIDVLKAMGKATYREVAARMGIEPVEALNMLREQREQGLCDFYDGGWKVTGGHDNKSDLPAEPAKTVLHAKHLNYIHQKSLRSEVPEPVKPETIVALLTGSGNMDAVELASAVERDPRGLASNLCQMAKRGFIQKIGQGKGVKWGLPDDKAAPATLGSAELPDIEITPKAAVPVVAGPERVQIEVEEFLDSIPVLKKHTQSVSVPTLREISHQIRKTKSCLNSLEKLRDAVREVNRHRRVLRLFGGEEL
ncbi:DUF1627 domain-containing protein [Salmonella enterica subsp. salamae]|nr:DUF1627 domain-containing protein [Salmonella enterica subsp. salamae]